MTIEAESVETGQTFEMEVSEIRSSNLECLNQLGKNLTSALSACNDITTVLSLLPLQHPEDMSSKDKALIDCIEQCMSYVSPMNLNMQLSMLYGAGRAVMDLKTGLSDDCTTEDVDAFMESAESRLKERMDGEFSRLFDAKTSK